MTTSRLQPESKTNKLLLKEFTKLKNRDGLITANAVLDYARPKKSPLHKYFTWDDGEAAERYRLMEAQRLIQVTVTYLPNTEKITRAVVSLRQDRHKSGGSRLLVDVLSDEDLYNKYLQDALFELHIFTEKYRKIEELGPVIKASDKVRGKYDKK